MLEYENFSHYGPKLHLTTAYGFNLNFIIKINNSNKYYLLFFNNDIIKLYKLCQLGSYDDILFHESQKLEVLHIVNILSGERYWIRFITNDIVDGWWSYGILYILDDNFKPDDVDNIINYCELIDNINLL